MTKKTIQIRIEENLKDRSEYVLDQMGLNISDAVRIFLKQVVNDNALPFRPHIGEIDDD